MIDDAPSAANRADALGIDTAINRTAWAARFLQPQTLGSIICNSAALYFRNWGAICLIYILPLLPVAMLRAVFQVQGYTGWAAILFIGQTLGGILVSAALIVAVSDVCLGLKPNVRRAYRRAFADGRMIKTYLTFVLYIAVGGLLVVPAIVFIVWYMFSFPAAILERFKGRAALQRSRELGRGYYWRNIGIVIVCGLLMMVTLVVMGGLLRILEYLILGGGFLLLETILSEALAIVLFGPLSAIPSILLYYDMRARKEGYGAAQLIEDLRV